MPDVLRNTPLSALAGVAIDTETTGLDVKTARIVEIGAVAFGGATRRWSSLVNPGITIPAASVAIHNITNDMVRESSAFAAVWPEAEAFLGNCVLLGHSLGYDLAIIERECARAGLAMAKRLWLDTRYLALLLNARLPDFTLSTLAAWLDVDISANHRALGDAEATITIFEAMVPRLRDIGIHTLGEALLACRRLERMNDELTRAGWAEAGRTGPNEADTPGHERIDIYPYQHRVRELMSAPPLFTAGTSTLEDALALMAERRISSLFVGDATAPATDVGIITERDVLRAIARHGAAALVEEISSFASHPLALIPDGAFAYRAIGRMARLNIRHLAVLDEATGRVAGALSQRDLLRLRAGAAIVLGDDVDEAADVAGLGRAWARLPAMARALSEEGFAATAVAAIIARELGALTRRAATLAEQEMMAAGEGPPPCPYAVMVLGSAGRGESLLAMDQDNAVIFAEGAPDGPQDRWFAAFGKRICATLDVIGVPLCKGGVMASQPAFRGSVGTWRERMELWVGRSSPADLLNVDIVFDARTVHGDPALFAGVLRDFRNSAQASAPFLKLLVASHGEGAAPIGFFGKLRGDDEGRIDLKKHVISRTVAAARVLALRHGIETAATPARLTGVRMLGKGSSGDLEGMDAGFSNALKLLLRAQLNDISEGRKPGNAARLGSISAGDQARLKSDIQRLSNLDEIVRETLFS